MRYTFALIVIFICFALSGRAYAGAWTQVAGRGQAILTASYYSTDHYWDNQGQRHPQAAYEQYGLNPNLEYGLWDGLTVGGSTFLQHVHQGDETNFGLGDSEIFARQRLWQGDGFIVSAEPMVKLPSPSGDLPRLGGSSPDAGLGLNGGYGFRALGRDHFIDIDTQYRHRFGTPKDQVNFAATLGVGMTQNLTLMPQLFLTYRTAKPAIASFTESSADDYNLAKLQLSAVYKWSDVALQGGGFANVAGTNTGGGYGVLFAVWKHF